MLKKKTKKTSNPENICRMPLTANEQCAEVVHPPKMSDITWRIFRIMAEFVEGFQFLSGHEKEVTIFGSARFPSDHHWYKEADKFGTLLAKNGFTTVTGGGPGIMEGANKGAMENGGVSIGLNIELPTEQRVNPFVTQSRGFHYFFTRKVMLAASAQAYVFFPGGFGTLDEMFEMVTLIQTGKAQKIPVVCVGKDFWGPLKDWMDKTLRDELETISVHDADIMQVVDTAEEAYELIKDSEERSFF